MPSERLSLPAWIEKMLESRDFSVLRWQDKSKRLFTISWIHASSHGWSQKEDAALFKEWAKHTGRYLPGQKPDPKTWKANFRCAVNASQDIQEVKGKGKHKGRNAHRVYMLSKNGKCKKFVAARMPGKTLSNFDMGIKKEPAESSNTLQYVPRPSRSRCPKAGLNNESKNMQENLYDEILNIKQEPNSPIDTNTMQYETDTKTLTNEFMNNETCELNFKEILEKISYNDNQLFDYEHNPLIHQLHQQTYNDLTEPINERPFAIADDPFPTNVEEYFERINEFIYHAETADTSSDSEGDMQEFLSDLRHRSISECSEASFDYSDLSPVTMEELCGQLTNNTIDKIPPFPNDPWLVSNAPYSDELSTILGKHLANMAF